MSNTFTLWMCFWDDSGIRVRCMVGGTPSSHVRGSYSRRFQACSLQQRHRRFFPPAGNARTYDGADMMPACFRPDTNN